MLEQLSHWASGYFNATRIAIIVRAVLILLGGLIASRVGRGWSRRLMALRGDPQQAELAGTLAAWAVFGLSFAWALNELGFNLGVLLGAAGVMTVAVGFAAQTTLSNLISGFFLFGERPFSVGDTIEVDGVSGEVLSVDMMSTKLRTFDNRYVRIPNESLIKVKVTNLTRFLVRRVEIVSRVNFDQKFDPIRKLLLEIADRDVRCLDEPAPTVFVSAFGDAGFDVSLWVWCRTENVVPLRAALNGAVQKAFLDNGVRPPLVTQLPGPAPRAA